MPTYRVKDWGKHFENAQSRKVLKLQWLPLPNKHDGKGYRRLAALPNAVDVFCGWCLILEVASKMPVRGVLADESGPLTAEDLADSTGYPERVFSAAFQALTGGRIDWLENSAVTEQTPSPLPVHPATLLDHPATSRERGTEGKGRELKGTEQHHHDGGNSLILGADVEELLRKTGVTVHRKLLEGIEEHNWTCPEMAEAWRAALDGNGSLDRKRGRFVAAIQDGTRLKGKP